VTRLLWENRTKDKLSNVASGEIVERTPSDSFLELVLPFSSDSILREQYVSPFGHLRMGRLLEDLDAFAGNCAFKHAYPSHPTIVTASVDKLDLIPKVINPNSDLKISGGVTSVGTSSMEIRIDCFQGEGFPCILTTYFTMVARDNHTLKATRVNPLVCSTAAEKKREREGELNKQARLLAKKQSLKVELPTQKEMREIHNFFISEQKEEPETLLPIAATHQRSLIFCSHQQRNIHNKIFGGYLMRKAFELAYSTAYLFAGKRPLFSALGDITFNNAVEIGALLDLRAAVVYTENNDIQVHVTARVHTPEQKKSIKTNDFAFSFELYNNEVTEPTPCEKHVRPHSYKEAMAYIEGQRCLYNHRKLSHD
jgi:acyl-coenzyme A thioesterase 9